MTQFSKFLHLAAAQATLVQVEDHYSDMCEMDATELEGEHHALPGSESVCDSLDDDARALELAYQGAKTGEAYGYNYTIVHYENEFSWSLDSFGDVFKSGTADTLISAISSCRKAARIEMEG